MDASQQFTMLIRKLQSIGHISQEERDAVSRLPVRVRQVDADQTIVKQGDRPSECCLVLEGIACRFTMTGNGKRQINSFHIPGDIPDLQSLQLKVMDHSLATVVPSKLGFIQHDSIRKLCWSYPRVADALWRDTLIDAAVFREWMTSIGRRDANARVAHLLCELLLRYQAVGLVHGDSFALPITQAEIGDALGLSTVHVNRTIQELRAAELIILRDRSLMVLDWDGLMRAGDFDPTYLHLQLPAAA